MHDRLAAPGPPRPSLDAFPLAQSEGLRVRWDRAAIRLSWLALTVVLVLGVIAPVRRTGDAHQYLAMAHALSKLRPPALTRAEVSDFKSWLIAQPLDSNFPSAERAIDQPPLVVAGRQEFSHFWFFPLLASPFVAAARADGVHEAYGFFALNALLLVVALRSLQRAFPPVVTLLIFASPLIWFVNKLQVEMFTFTAVCLAMSAARRGRFLLAGLFIAVASTQNLPIVAAVPVFWAAGLARWLLTRGEAATGAGDRPRYRNLLLTGALIAATLIVGSLHPAYYQLRLGVLTPQQLNGGIAGGVPSISRYLAVLLDPDIGLLPWVPVLALLTLFGMVRLLAGRVNPSMSDRLDLRLTAACAVLTAAWFLFVFAETSNVNSGGTVHVSRYALWLIPLLLPMLEESAVWFQAKRPSLLPLGGALLFVAYAAYFRPWLPERYVTPSPQSEALNGWFPGVYRQVPEVFYERHRGIDGATPDWAATASCTVMLLSVGTQEPACPLSASERQTADGLFGKGWRTVWIVRPGRLGLGADGVTGAIRAGS